MSATRHDIRIRDGGGKGFALVLSGLRYGCERPLLAAAVGLLAARGHTLMTVDFAYAADPRFAQMDDAAQFAAIEADGVALLHQAIERAMGAPLTIVGKSLGTIAMGGMLAADAVPPGARLIWLTPSLRGTPLLDRMRRWCGPALSLIGDRDPSVGITRSPVYLELKGLKHVEIAGADHGWTHPGGPAATDRIAGEAEAVMAAWLDGRG